MQVLPYQRIMARLFVMGAAIITPAIYQRVSLAGHYATLLSIDEPPRAREQKPPGDNNPPAQPNPPGEAI